MVVHGKTVERSCPCRFGTGSASLRKRLAGDIAIALERPVSRLEKLQERRREIRRVRAFDKSLGETGRHLNQIDGRRSSRVREPRHEPVGGRSPYRFHSSILEKSLLPPNNWPDLGVIGQNTDDQFV